jgi:DNA-directed RNA polymerase specialized sigma24 family protein
VSETPEASDTLQSNRAGSDIAGEYKELRRLLDNGDPGAVKSEIQFPLGKGYSMDQMAKAVGIGKGGGVSPILFTGSRDREQAMLRSLSPDHLELYHDAQREHQEQARMFTKLWRGMHAKIRWYVSGWALRFTGIIPQIGRFQSRNGEFPRFSVRRRDVGRRFKTLMPFVRMNAASSCPGVSIPGWKCRSGFSCFAGESAPRRNYSSRAARIRRSRESVLLCEALTGLALGGAELGLRSMIPSPACCLGARRIQLPFVRSLGHKPSGGSTLNGEKYVSYSDDDCRSFRTTQWSVVGRAVGRNDGESMRALSSLCESCWYPIYAYFRRAGRDFHDAEDLTQGFFAHLLEKGTFATADPSKGKLRTFLLTCARNFLNDEYGRAEALKRGRGILTSFDAARAEGRYVKEPVDDLSPDRLFQRRWAFAVLEHSLRDLREEFTASGKGETFKALRPFLGFGPEPEKRYEDVSRTLGVPVGTLKNQVFRLRERWRELLFDEVRATLDEPSPEEIKEELKELLASV